MAHIVLVGEGMIELSRGANGWTVGQGGDMLNTALHLARFGDRAGLLTALGDDPFSADLRTAWVGEGLDPALILKIAAAAPGLYAITTDDRGERAFTYWRGDSAARRMFSAPGIATALASVAQADLLGFSLISLAILPPEGREALLDLALRMRAAGRHVAFDGNYRPRLWASPEEARRWRDRAIACCTIGLPTHDDEAALDDVPSPEAIAARWAAHGAEIVVKLGADGCLLPDGRRLAPGARLVPRDTSGAGDAFDAGYLHARLAGAAPELAAALGHRLAGWVIQRSGAAPARDADAPYALAGDRTCS